MPIRSTISRIVVRLVTLLAVYCLCPIANADGFWPVSTMAINRQAHTATLLLDGRVLVVGGYRFTPGFYADAEIYTPATNSWIAAGKLSKARANHTATLLQNGKVLVAGGRGLGNVPVAEAELFDPNTNSWSIVGRLTEARSSHTATLLPNGKVLVAGGHTAARYFALSTTEVFDPATNSWAAGKSMSFPHDWHTATLLLNGKVLIAGGYEYYDVHSNLVSGTSPMELFDPSKNTWVILNDLRWPDFVKRSPVNRHAATLLLDGKVLFTGGWYQSKFEQALFDAWIYDPNQNSWTVAAPMAKNIYLHTATLLRNGTVLVTAAESNVYAPTTNSWSPVCTDRGSGECRSSQLAQRSEHTATLISSGQVLLAGGVVVTSQEVRNAEAYVSAPPASSLDCLYSWAELAFKQFFSPRTNTSMIYFPYYFRYYKDTGNYLAVSSEDSSVWVLGPMSGDALLGIGPAGPYLAAAGCK